MTFVDFTDNNDLTNDVLLERSYSNIMNPIADIDVFIHLDKITLDVERSADQEDPNYESDSGKTAMKASGVIFRGSRNIEVTSTPGGKAQNADYWFLTVTKLVTSDTVIYKGLRYECNLVEEVPVNTRELGYRVGLVLIK